MNIEDIKQSAQRCCDKGEDWVELDEKKFDWLVAEVEQLQAQLDYLNHVLDSYDRRNR